MIDRDAGQGRSCSLTGAPAEPRRNRGDLPDLSRRACQHSQDADSAPGQSKVIDWRAFFDFGLNSGYTALERAENLERAKGFEPSTPTLARLCSTPELRPLWRPEEVSLSAGGGQLAAASHLGKGESA